MRDQEKRPGELLKQLRETLGYNPEDWATIFETETSTIQAIEAGNEIPDDFLTALLQWFLDGLEHPQNPTQVLPEGWEDDLPNAIGVLLGSIEHKNAALEDLQDAYDLQKKVIAHGNERAKGYQQQILNYLEMIRQQNDKIKALEGIKEVDQKTIRFKAINKISMVAFFVMLAGILCWHADQWWTLDKQVAAEIKPMVWNNEVISVKLPVSAIEKRVRSPLTRQISVPNDPPQITARKREVLAKPIAKKKPETKNNVKGVNEGLLDLLAVDSERKIPDPKKYISDKGEVVLKFENPSKKTMVITIDNQILEEIHRDTTQSHQYLLDISKYKIGRYFYRVYTLSSIDQKTTGSFKVKHPK